MPLLGILSTEAEIEATTPIMPAAGPSGCLSQPLVLAAGFGELSALLKVGWRSASSRAPPRVPLDREVATSITKEVKRRVPYRLDGKVSTPRSYELHPRSGRRGNGL